MTRREAHVVALGLAYTAIQKSVEAGPEQEEGDRPHADQVKIEEALAALAQAAYNRWRRGLGGQARWTR